VFPLVIDLIAKNLDLKNMPQLVSRLETLVPPPLLAKEKGLPPPPPPPPPPQQPPDPMVMAQMQNMQQEMQIKQEKNQIEKMKVLATLQGLQQQASAMQTKSQAEVEKASNDFSIQLLKLIKEVQSEMRT
jgi:hypothetical protein